MTKQKKYRYSEIFRSIQGEGHYTGIPTVWYRAWGCNFNCLGFGSSDPQNVKLEDLPYMNIPLDDIKSVEDLPVFKQGCDSSYSWSKRYRHLASMHTSSEICDKLTNLLPSKSFLDKNSKQYWHMAFTGGEPLMSQSAVVDIMTEFDNKENTSAFIGPKYVTFETNGTQKLRSNFVDYFNKYDGEIFWSCSPKLYASGEKWDQAIRPDILSEYNKISTCGQLKYVVDGSDEVWNEVKKATDEYRDAGIDWPVWIMPVGALQEQQMEIAGEIADQALDRGYNVSARVHCYLWSNAIGK